MLPCTGCANPVAPERRRDRPADAAGPRHAGARRCRRQRWVQPLKVGLSITGYVLLVGILWWGISTGLFWLPGGDTHIWDRAGDTLRAGGEVYAIQPLRNETIWYAPPFVVMFAAVSWLPIEVMYVAIVALEVAALRYLAGRGLPSAGPASSR